MVDVYVGDLFGGWEDLCVDEVFEYFVVVEVMIVGVVFDDFELRNKGVRIIGICGIYWVVVWVGVFELISVWIY